MANTIEMFLATIALLINTCLIFVLIFINASFLPPFIKALNSIVKGKQVIPIGDYTWIFPYIFAVLILFEFIFIYAFIVVLGRRTTYEDEI